jgi:endoglucanase
VLKIRTITSYQPPIIIFLLLCFSLIESIHAQYSDQGPQLNDLEYFESRGLNVLVFSNGYDGNFSDAKMSGIEIIHHGVRTATNGDVRLSPTPAQWDPIPQLLDRKVDKNNNSITVRLSYPVFHFDYTLKAESRAGGILISVNLDQPVPAKLAGQAGFQLEFLPAAYFEKTFVMDGKSGIFPLYAGGPMELTHSGSVEPKPIATGAALILAPEEPLRRVNIESRTGELCLYDGRNQAQNGWYVVRTLIPPEKTGKVVEWFISAGTIPGWIRTPMIAYSQVGYHPKQKKVAVIEFDTNDQPLTTARLLQVIDNGKFVEKFSGELKNWGKFLRYNYFTFDFSQVQESGLYVIDYDSIRTKPFRIDSDVYDQAWQPTLDVFFPVQMDHMFVNEAYRVWHGASFMDDARQAPVNHDHFDLYAQGPTTDTPYKPGQHIPGLNTGGWFDAGDHDIRTQTHYHTVVNLVHLWEDFGLNRDETLIDQKNRYADIHHPDGKPDLLQQIEHGTLALIAQFRAVGHAIPGIIAPDLSQYTHLGDAVTITDNQVRDPNLDSLGSAEFTSKTFDDRWAFTSKSTALNYGSSAALAAASRALRGYNDELADECFNTAQRVWLEEHSHEPVIFIHGNTTGGPLEFEELSAAVELLICTKDKKYAQRINELLPALQDRFIFSAAMLVQAMPYMDKAYQQKLKVLVKKYAADLEKFKDQNPFQVPITTGGWGGAGAVMGFAITNYRLFKIFPDLVDPEYVYAGLNYLYGCHPGSNISFVSAVGTQSKKIAYGTNRADYSFIAGGIVPGIMIVKPDFPENKEDWPFIWGENEYVINMGSSYIYLVNAVNELLNHR